MTVYYPLPGGEKLAGDLAAITGDEVGTLETRRFPDGESYLRFPESVAGRRVVLVGSLDEPDGKFLPLIYAAAAARELGASEVGLIAPYLAYLRQDKRFRFGEAVTSTYFAAALAPWLDWLLTVDPHLHRRQSLSEIYTIRTRVVHAAPEIAGWIRRHVAAPVLIGPDVESEQWVAAVADLAGAPFLILRKTRQGDRDVEISVPDVDRWKHHTPVLVDDIISTAHTMIETVAHLTAAKLPPPVCIGVHGVFAGSAYEDLRAASVSDIVTCDTIPHPSNRIELAPLIARNLATMMTAG